MKEFITINKMAEQMGLTSRTLRHWESEGLFSSIRDVNSGWRTYDEHAVLCIRITAVLRSMDIPIKDIGFVLSSMSIDDLHNVILKKIDVIKNEYKEIAEKRSRLEELLLDLKGCGNRIIDEDSIGQIQKLMEIKKEKSKNKEELNMNNASTADQVKFVTLPSMRMAYHIAVSVSPEDEAMEPVIEWLKAKKLLGTARMFGGNMKPMPSGEGKPYGYGFCATVPEGTEIPENLDEMTVEGGLYAVIDSTDDIGGSWKKLMNYLAKHEKYKADHSRLCFEEHIRNDEPEGCGNEYSLRLMEPVKLK